jgi:hypothetical protein
MQDTVRLDVYAWESQLLTPQDAASEKMFLMPDRGSCSSRMSMLNRLNFNSMLVVVIDLPAGPANVLLPTSW